MAPLTFRDKQSLISDVHLYIAGGGKFSSKRYERLMAWLNGMTYREIAEEQGTTVQAVAHSVKRDLQTVLDFGQHKQ